MSDINVAEGREAIVLEFGFGDRIVQVSVDYPSGQVALALAALAEAGSEESVSGLLYGLRHEPSVTAMLKDAGLTYDDADDDEEPEEDA